MNTRLLILAFVSIMAIILAGCTKTPGQQTGSSSLIDNETPPEKNQAVNTQLENKLVALGSSLTRASNLSIDKQGENEDYNFSTGIKIESLYIYLKKEYNDLTAVNLASPGAEMKDILERQLPQALKENPKFISLDPGADIVSRQPSVSRFKQDLGQIIQKINPETTTFLFTYPNFTIMRTANHVSCQENKVGVNLENLSETNVQKFNQAIKEVVAEKNNVILINIYNLLGPEDISDYDCLHLNANGQKKIAQQFINFLNK